MPTVYDVPANILIERLAAYLKENVTEIEPPPWVAFTKTGAHAERPPQNPDWWYTRCASLLRKIYVIGPVGVSRLSKEYGGRVGGEMHAEHFRRGGRTILRTALQQLEAAKLVAVKGKEGRVMTKDGRSTIDRLAGEMKRELERSLPELKKY